MAAEPGLRCSSDGSAVEVPPDSDSAPGSLAAQTEQEETTKS